MPRHKVKCGVIGAGWWGTYAHIPALLSHPDAELVAVQTRDAEAARKIGQHFGIRRITESSDELLAIEGLEAVVVSSPPNLHYSQAKAALRRGLHVLVEKPMTLKADEACELVRLAADRQLQLVVSCPWQYTRHGQEARRLTTSGALGEVRMISVLMTNPVDHLIRGDATETTHGEGLLRPNSATYSDPAVAGGGQIYTQVSHAAAYLSFLTGEPPRRVFARFHNDGGHLDIYDALNVRMEGGCLVTIASTGATPVSRRDFEVRIFGTRAIVFLELWRGSMELLCRDGAPEVVYPPLSEDEIYPEQAPARNLIDCVARGAANLSPGEIGLHAVELLEAACLSARSGVDVAIAARD